MIGGTVDQALMRAESGTVPIGTMQRRRIGQEWKHASGDQLISVTGFKGCAAGLQVKRIVCGAGTGVKSQSQHLLNLGVRSSVTVWNLWLCEACDYVKPVVKDFASPGTPSATMLV